MVVQIWWKIFLYFEEIKVPEATTSILLGKLIPPEYMMITESERVVNSHKPMVMTRKLQSHKEDLQDTNL